MVVSWRSCTCWFVYIRGYGVSWTEVERMLVCVRSTDRAPALSQARGSRGSVERTGELCGLTPLLVYEEGGVMQQSL